ncbi:MAG TPA: alpha/beta hydrolase [Pseudomonas sp.]|nr:alpha/beta hydrolase [Pseudomonas sp.]
MPSSTTPSSSAALPAPGSDTAADLRGVSQLIITAVTGVTDIVEDMHRNIATPSSLIGKAPAGRTRGITGLVYRSVRGVTNGVGSLLDIALAQLSPLIPKQAFSPRREALLAALNGVLGDYLIADQNPLAIPMRLRQNGVPLELTPEALASRFRDSDGRLLILAHGLCMNDLQWQRDGHDHGAGLATEFGYTALYLNYNSGRHISSNGHEFAATLEQLINAWPVPVRELVIVGHSMGGLITRSACHYAEEAGHRWPGVLKKMVFLGSPHHGAPLERAGNRANLLVGISPYSAPLTRLGMIRSSGIRDLRFGNLLDEDWQDQDEHHKHDPRLSVPLHAGVECYVVAATKGKQPAARLPGDGLVQVHSALGQHRNSALSLPIPASQQLIVYDTDHFALLSNQQVYQQLLVWLR